MKRNKTISIPEDLFEAISAKPDINWSNIAAAAFRRRLGQADSPDNREIVVRVIISFEGGNDANSKK
jgi:hypothetical protein